jgi:hypothetical protein
MTRKDYVELAKVMNRLVLAVEPKTAESKAIDQAVNDLVEWLSIENPRFNSLRFIGAVYKA